MAINVTGKKIYELEGVTVLKDEAWLPISQDNNTRKITAFEVKKYLNGDNDEPGEYSYYSSKKINELIGNFNTDLTDIYNRLNSIDANIEALSTTVINNYDDLSLRITNLQTKLEGDISTLNENLKSYINTQNGLIRSDMRTMDLRLSKDINDLNTKIELSISNLNTSLRNYIQEVLTAIWQ